MTALRSINAQDNVIEVEAGMILADVQTAAKDVDRLFPLSLAAEGSARIGGTLATNAGGINVLRYGMARDLCLGVEVVLADGSIWNGLSKLRKDNTGYDLRNLIIGSEGTLGIITAASLRLFPRPRAQGTALFVVQSPAAALRLLDLARGTFGNDISAFELMHRMGLLFLAQTLPDVRLPLGTDAEWSVLLDVGCGAEAVDIEAQMAALYASAMDAGLVLDGVLAQSEQQRQDIWHMREAIPLANRHIGAVSSHDISVPISAIPDFIKAADQRIAGLGSFRVNCFGHLGDGNLHYNVFPAPGKTREDHLGEREAIKKTVHDCVHSLGGSVSAEHGVGRLKVTDLETYGDPAKLTMMRAIKAALDPKGILNPGVILRGGVGEGCCGLG